jgi:hypothetical protein
MWAILNFENPEKKTKKDHIPGLTPNIKLSWYSEEMPQDDMGRFLHEGLPVNTFHQYLVDVFRKKVMTSYTITRTLRKISWICPEI